MQRTKTIKIDDTRSFTIKELPNSIIWDLINNKQTSAAGSMFDRCQDLLNLACPELTLEALLTLYPSETEELWHAFEEVNASFLGPVRRVGLIDIVIDGIKPILAEEFAKLSKERQASDLPKTSTGQFASLSQQDTVPESGTTDSVSS